MINGIVDAFSGTVLTKPYVLRLTENKVYQLLYAEKYGFIIPSSYIGNDQHQADQYNQGIIKPLSTGKVHTNNGYEIYQTNIFQGVNEAICLTPLYVQEYIKKQYEVRVTIINQHVYAVRIDTIDQVDWRNDYEHHHYTLVQDLAAFFRLILFVVWNLISLDCIVCYLYYKRGLYGIFINTTNI